MKRIVFLAALLALAGCSQNYASREACRDAAEERFTRCHAGCGDGIFGHSCLGCDNGLAMDRIGCGNGFFLEDGNV